MLDTGHLEVIDNQVDQTTGTIRLKADFPNKDLQLWPGQFVNVRMLLNTLDQVVVVPTSAVQRGPEGTFVYVVGADNKASVRPIAVTQQDDKLAVISKGVAPSDMVVTTGFARLKDGAEVTVSPPADAKPAAASDTRHTAGRMPARRRPAIRHRSTRRHRQTCRATCAGEFRQGKRGDGKRGSRREAGNPPGTAR